MSIRTRILPAVPILLIAGLWLAPSLLAAETTPVHCAANDDRVWVYDSLTSFTVELRLKCGDPVEVVGRSKGYVKIRTADGKEGYVPDAAIANLPPYQDPQAIPVEGLASLARARKAAAAQPAAAPVISANATAKPIPPTHEATAVMTIEPLPPSESPSSASAAAPAAHVKPVSVAPKKTAKPAAKKPTPAPSQPPAPPASTATTASLVSPAPAKSNPQVAYLSSNSANTSPRIESAVEKGPVAIAANTSMNMKQSAAASMRPVADSESEDEPDSQPVDQSADPACRVFFSAYGLAPAQYRWIAQNRLKKYPGICPAAGPAQVDFVMIFTHDIEIFNSTLPDAVHVDKNGFSDFSPLTMVDSALMPEAYADKAHHQYVWVFRMKRGAFDPTKFSPRRRFQFTKQESSAHSTDRAAEDAFQFIDEQGTTR